MSESATISSSACCKTRSRPRSNFNKLNGRCWQGPALPRAAFKCPSGPMRADLFLDPLDVAAAEGLDFAAELEVAANLLVGEDSEAVHHGQRSARPADDLFGIELQIGLVRHGQDQGFGVVQRGGQVLLDADILQAFLVAEEPRPRMAGRG